ncbi:MAG: class I SAM-dependent DNA methyltransferase, partial [Arcicella sp.]|nr:class I SAM-dependent DNA methyltransferase [Arcicella sp.]
MNITQITDSLQNLLTHFDKDQFIYQLLRSYNIPNASIERLKKGTHNLSKIEGEIDWKTKLFFKPLDLAENLQEAMAVLKTEGKALKHSPRFVVLTDFVNLLAFDTKMSETLDIQLVELVKHYDFFLPWAGMEKSVHKTEHPADVKAAEKMAKLYDEIKKENSTATHEEVHNLNVFLSRLLFCFFAEDTAIFPKSQLFTHDIQDHTHEDGTFLNQYLDDLFEVMNTDLPQRDKSLAQNLAEFPYVNGGLFRNKHYAPVFTKRSRQMLIDSGEMNWADINPDIFGSMIQAVITPEHRGGMGMHYTSVPNIMKVIEPLFLDNLHEEFENAKGNIKKINDLLKRIWNIKIFDPACGSGNFLIIAYKKMRELEMAIFKEIDRINQTFTTQFTGISLDNFYGIELDDFAHEIAILSLWLAEHQMNQVFFKAFGRALPALPLKETGNIFQGNATRLDWEVVCPKKESDEIYILGNPPYLGGKGQSEEQKLDMELTFRGNKNFKELDYIACWFLLGSKFIANNSSKFAFVTTSSICEGAQVEQIWTLISNMQNEIFFAYTPFNWTNNAKDKAGVTCSIIGLRKVNGDKKFLYNKEIRRQVSRINGYLTTGSETYVTKSLTSISNLPAMITGNSPYEGGNLLLSFEEKTELLASFPEINPFLKKIIGSNEFINGIDRWCIWIENHELESATKILPIRERIELVKEFRKTGGEVARGLVNRSHQFRYTHKCKKSQLVIPRVSSSRRDYIPIGFLDDSFIISDSAQAIYDSETYIFSIISSNIHMLWVRLTSGKLRGDIRYLSALSYNTFPFPPISDSQKDELKKHVFRILEEREHHSEKTLAQLYDPDKMPEGLREAHHQNDLAVERCYRSRLFESDEERL